MLLSADSLHRNVKQSLQSSFETQWFNDIDTSNKCLFYKKCKKHFEQEKYVKILPDMYVISFMKFRCGNHNLPIEVGRRYNVPRNQRLCTKCNLSALGDEYHFFMECPHCNNLRTKYISNEILKPVNTFHFCEIMSSNDKITLLKIGNFLKYSKIF